MGYPPQRPGNNGTAIVIVICLALVGMMTLAGLGISILMVTRTTARRELVVAERARAVALQQRLRAEQAVQAARRAEEVARQVHAAQEGHAGLADKLAGDGQPVMRIAIDRRGQISLEDEPIALAELRERLGAARQEQGSLSLIIQADRQCLIKHIQSVLSLCQDEKFGDVRIESVERDAGADDGLPLEAEAQDGGVGSPDVSR